MSEWVRIQAKSGPKDAWLDVFGPGKPEVTGEPWYLPDGITNVYPFIEDWRPEKLPFPVWLAPFNKGTRFGDLLWTGGIALKIASTRFIEALRAAEITGYRVFDVSIRDHANEPLEGYTGFATAPFPDSDIRNLFDQDHQNYAFVANQRVVEALRRYNADQVEIQPYQP